MEANQKIYVSEYLKYINNRIKKEKVYKYYNRHNENYIKTITCKELAELCEVTPATISNLTTSSKFILIHRIAEEILNTYFAFFYYDEQKAREQNPDTPIQPRDINYIIMQLTEYFTREYLFK